VANNIATAYHNLSVMLDAGVPLLRSLKVVAEGMEPHLRRAFLGLAESASKGNTLAETMVRSPGIFEPVDVMLIRAAETSGSLPESFKLLSKWREFTQRMTHLLHLEFGTSLIVSSYKICFRIVSRFYTLQSNRLAVVSIGSASAVTQRRKHQRPWQWYQQYRCESCSAYRIP